MERGYNTYAVGKWHLTPEEEGNQASSKRNWPTDRGFERFYGFMGGETNQWYPDLFYDNHMINPPSTPEEGYHLSKDLTDQAIKMVQGAKQIAPDKPFFMYFCPGCAHAPHHVFKEWADKYKGKFDDGYEKYREATLDRQKKMGLLPKDTELTQFAKGNIAFGVGVMTLLMVVTVVVLPTALPLIVPGVKVDPWAVAQPLIFLMLIPLGIGLLVKSRYEPFAEHAAGILNRATSFSIIILLFLFFGAFWDQIISTFGTGAVGFSIFFVVFALIVGYFLGGRETGTKRVLGIATAQRNIAAGILTAATNFGDRPLVGVTVILVSLASLIILMIAAGEWGRKGSKGTPSAEKEAMK